MRWLALVLLAGSVFAQEAPAAKAIDRDAFTFLRYSLNVSLNLPRHGIAVRGTVTVRNDAQQPQARIALQVSSSLKWAAIKANGEPLPFTAERVVSDIDHTGAVSEAIAELATPVQPGAALELEVGYQGSISQDASRLQNLGMPGTLAACSDWDQISETLTGLRGVGYVAWYPVALLPATLSDGNKVFQELGVWRARHADSQFRVTYTEDSGKTLLANGSRRSEVEKIFQMDRMGLEGPFLVIAELKALDTANGRIYYQPGSEETARKVGASLVRLEPPVTKAKAAPAVIVQLPNGWAAYESGPSLLLPFTWNSDKELDLQLVHTLTHVNLYSARPWIYEGLAHMAQAALREKQEGRQAALDFLEQRRLPLTLIAPTESGPNDARNSLINATDETYYRSKAMWVWWMLRDMLGPEVINKAMAAYQPDADKEPAYVQRLLETASGKELEWFFDDWVYRDRGLADLRIVSVYPRQTLKGSYLVTVTVENLGRAGAEVPVRVQMAEGDVSARLIVKGKSQATVRVDAPRPVVKVLVNDGSVLESDLDNNSFLMPAEKQ